MKKPNILYIFSDQHRKFDLGAYGHQSVLTPNLDELAKLGVRFNHCVSNSPVCVPARGTMLTGLYPNKHGALMNDMAINPQCTSIANVLNSEGYRTGYMGKWHLNGVPRDQAIPQEKRLGFQEWKVHNCNHKYLDCYYYDEENEKHEVEGYEPVIFGELAEEFIERNAKEDQPWALYLSFSTPHDPHQDIEKKYLEVYENKDIPLRKNTKDKILFKENKALNLNEYFDTQEYRENAKGYYGHISAIDEQIGKLILSLKETDQYDNTIIIYTSDHGDMLGSQGMLDKQVPFEEAIAIPLIIYWKNHTYAGVCDELIGLNDLPVTIAGLIGAKFPDTIDGVDLQELCLNPLAQSYDSAYLCEYFPAHNWGDKGGTEWRAIRTKQYTYAVTANNTNWLLFDNIHDPYQTNNLACDVKYKNIKAELWKMLKKHIDENDALLEGIQFIREYGNVNEFNRSQNYFNRKPIIETDKEGGNL